MSASEADTGGGGERVAISVGGRVGHTMLSGAGASWHSIVEPTVSAGGSAFGGCPPPAPRNEKLWSSVERHAAWLGLSFIRAEIDWRQWQPERGVYTWDSDGMRILFRILDWSQRHGADVMLQSMWANVGWLAFPEYRSDPAAIQTSAPADLDAFARGWVSLLRELRARRGYTCIRWVCLVNEPNYYWWLIPPDTGASRNLPRQARYLGEALRRVRGALKKARIPVRILGPDYTDLPVIGRLSAEPWWAHVDDVDFHSYCSCFDWEDPDAQVASGSYRMGERLERTLSRYRRVTSREGKGLMLTEAGTQTYGYKADSEMPGCFKASLKDTELLVRTLNLGIDAYNHWSLVNRGDQDGQWQLVDTWDRQWKRWMPEAAPHRDSYYVLGLALRHLPKNAQVLETEVEGGVVRGVPRVWACAARSPRDGSLSLIIVNDAQRPWDARLSTDTSRGPFYQLVSVPGGNPARAVRYRKATSKDGAILTRLPPFSLTILTDARLPEHGPGRF